VDQAFPISTLSPSRSPLAGSRGSPSQGRRSAGNTRLTHARVCTRRQGFGRGANVIAGPPTLSGRHHSWHDPESCCRRPTKQAQSWIGPTRPQEARCSEDLGGRAPNL
jgi:hypothetical protein